jgi:hypothetical protein
MRADSCALFVCAWILWAAPVLAQSSTEDGIRAVLRGDHPGAIRVLRPLADNPEHPDPVAQFFLGLLYEAGAGVRRDEGRACGLFLRSSASEHPFSQQSAAIAALLTQQLGEQARILCAANEQWQGGPPQSFVLGPSHQIVFADTSITVTSGDDETRATLLPQEGVWNHIQYTPIESKGARRHFLQWCQWTADSVADPSSWTLDWVLSEVVADQLMPIAVEKSIATVKGSTRPESYDLSQVVRLLVNASGDVEFTVLGGPSPRTEAVHGQTKR